MTPPVIKSKKRKSSIGNPCAGRPLTINPQFARITCAGLYQCFLRETPEATLCISVSGLLTRLVLGRLKRRHTSPGSKLLSWRVAYCRLAKARRSTPDWPAKPALEDTFQGPTQLHVFFSSHMAVGQNSTTRGPLGVGVSPCLYQETPFWVPIFDPFFFFSWQSVENSWTVSRPPELHAVAARRAVAKRRLREDGAGGGPQPRALPGAFGPRLSRCPGRPPPHLPSPTQWVCLKHEPKMVGLLRASFNQKQDPYTSLSGVNP